MWFFYWHTFRTVALVLSPAIDPEDSFLVALETAKRIGELQVLFAHVGCQGSDMVLSYLLDFVVKTETSTTHSLGSCVNKSLGYSAWITVKGSSVLLGFFNGTFTGHCLHLGSDICSSWS